MLEREDKAFEEYLGGGSRLSGAYRDSASDEPSADLDEVVIEAARRELHLGPKVAYSPFTRSWRWPLALAAVLVVSVTVTFVLHEQAGEPLPVPRQAPADVGTRETTEQRTTPETAAPPPSPRKKAPLLEPKAVAPSRERAPASAAERAAPFPAESAAPSSPEIRIPAAGDAAAPAAPALREEKARGGVSLRAAKEAPEMTPEQWLAKIEALRKEGRQAEADALLAEFRKRFPDYPLPEGVK